jgi:hypothetical protein
LAQRQSDYAKTPIHAEFALFWICSFVRQIVGETLGNVSESLELVVTRVNIRERHGIAIGSLTQRLKNVFDRRDSGESSREEHESIGRESHSYNVIYGVLQREQNQPKW